MPVFVASWQPMAATPSCGRRSLCGRYKARKTSNRRLGRRSSVRGKGHAGETKVGGVVEKFKMIRGAAGLGDGGDKKVEAGMLGKLLEGD